MPESGSMHVVANTIIPAQSDTYRHLQTRVTDLLADSGQTPSPTNPRPNPRLAHTTEIFTNPLIPAENALTVNHLVNRPGFAGGSSWGDDVDHGPEDEVYARGIRTWTGFSAICPMWTPDVRSGDIREVRITVATGLGTIGVAGSPAVLATLARDHECRGARVRSTTRLPPTLPGVSVRPTPNVLDWTAETLPLMSTASHLTVVRPNALIVRTSPTLRARWAL